MKKKVMGILATLFFTLVSIVFVAPIFIVLINSMKSKTFINLETFKLPTEESYVGLENYKTAITQYDFLKAVGWTLFITVFSVAVILICCSMTAWFITRVKNVFTITIPQGVFRWRESAVPESVNITIWNGMTMENTHKR